MDPCCRSTKVHGHDQPPGRVMTAGGGKEGKQSEKVHRPSLLVIFLRLEVETTSSLFLISVLFLHVRNIL